MIQRQRYFSIVLFVILMISAIMIIHASWKSGQESIKTDVETGSFEASIPTEEGVFKRSGFAMDYEQMPIDEEHQRTLDDYYESRAYPGAPPIVPHSLLGINTIGGKSCLQCHENGGYVAQFEAYAPITPHPELVNCLQCHVPQQTKANFVGTNWEKFPHSKIKNSALEGSPPVIPHDLQMRENCLSCHAGPSAPKEILVTHPMRINCRQCHVPVKNVDLIKLDSALVFTRKLMK